MTPEMQQPIRENLALQWSSELIQGRLLAHEQPAGTRAFMRL